MILIVDDDPDIRQLATLSLQLEGLEVQTCADGSSALRALETQRFELVILDLMMPDMSGYQILDEICRRLPDNAPPVALFTARPADLTQRDLQRRGVVGVLPKPFVPAELASSVRKLIHTSQ